MTNRAYEWVAEGEAEERARLRAERRHKGRHVRPSWWRALWRRFR